MGDQNTRVGLLDGVTDVVRRDLEEFPRVDEWDIADLAATDELDRPHCLVVDTAQIDGEVSDRLERLTELDSFLPVVVVDHEPSVDRASAVSAFESVAYLPVESIGEGTLADRVERAAERRAEFLRYRRNDQRLTALLEGIPHSIYIKDENARHVAVSSHLADSIDVDPIGKTDAEIWGTDAGDAGERSYHDDLEVIETGEPVIDRLERLEPVEGDEMWMLTTKLPWRDENGEIRGVVGITIDITDQQREMIELSETAERLEQFTSFVSHDLRNPINVAKGFLEHALETGDQSSLDRVDQALDHMETLVDDLLTMVQEGETKPEAVRFGPFVQRTWTAADTGDLTLELALPDDTRIEAVPGQLRQLLDNLFRNAREHGDSADLVRVGRINTGFFVEDDGQGIPAEFREQVLEYGHSDAGTGIGLAIVKEIAGAHDWDIAVTEGRDGGARFEFRNCFIRTGDIDRREAGSRIELTHDRDVGGSRPQGRNEHTADDETWQVSAGGEDIFGDIDEHYFVFGRADPPVRIEARVDAFDGVHEYSKAGVMIRESPETGSTLAFHGITRDYGSEVGSRRFDGNEIETDQYPEFPDLPRWYRIDWIDNRVIYETSSDGEDWETLAEHPIDGDGTLALGLAACSHDRETACDVTFAEVNAVELDVPLAAVEPYMP